MKTKTMYVCEACGKKRSHYCFSFEDLKNRNYICVGCKEYIDRKRKHYDAVESITNEIFEAED